MKENTSKCNVCYGKNGLHKFSCYLLDRKKVTFTASEFGGKMVPKNLICCSSKFANVKETPRRDQMKLAEIQTDDQTWIVVYLRHGMSQIVDPRLVLQACTEVVAKSAKQVEQYKAGKTALFGYFVGQVMKATKGSANPELVNETLRRMLNERSG